MRTRISVANIDDCKKVGEAHDAAFGENRPATSMGRISRLINNDILAEMEADAILSDVSASEISDAMATDMRCDNDSTS